MIADKAQHPQQNNVLLTSRLNNHFYSVDIGPVHVVMLSSEYYYYTEYGWDQIERQYRWIEQDLKRASLNRAQRPWIIAMAHRSFYCLIISDNSCINDTRPDIRQGIHLHGNASNPRQFGLEEIFYRYGVDIFGNVFSLTIDQVSQLTLFKHFC